MLVAYYVILHSLLYQSVSVAVWQTPLYWATTVEKQKNGSVSGLLGMNWQIKGRQPSFFSSEGRTRVSFLNRGNVALYDLMALSGTVRDVTV